MNRQIKVIELKKQSVFALLDRKLEVVAWDVEVNLQLRNFVKVF